MIFANLILTKEEIHEIWQAKTIPFHSLPRRVNDKLLISYSKEIVMIIVKLETNYSVKLKKIES